MTISEGKRKTKCMDRKEDRRCFVQQLKEKEEAKSYQEVKKRIESSGNQRELRS